MDAFFRGLLVVTALASLGAGYRTPNFVVTAPTAEFAKQVGDAAEIYREELAIDWTGHPLPGNWSTPCPILVTVGPMGAEGKTTFNFQNGEVYGWDMEIKGSAERILDSVLPHEINHTILACLFRRPLPRWADEGAASLIEHGSERLRLRKIHDQVMGTKRKIPLRTLLEMKNYPSERQQILTLYAEGHSLADFLIQKSDKPTFLKFLQVAHDEGWDVALKRYGYDNVDSAEKDWDQWVMAGYPSLIVPAGTLLADNSVDMPRGKAKAAETIRGQTPSDETAGAESLRDSSRNKSDFPSSDASSIDKLQPQSPQVAENPVPRRNRNTLVAPLLTKPKSAGAARFPHERYSKQLPVTK